MDDPHACLHFIYILTSLTSTVELFDTVFFLRVDLSLLLDHAHIHIPVLPLMVSAERVFAYPQNRSRKAAQIMLRPETDGIITAFFIPACYGQYFQIPTLFL